MKYSVPFTQISNKIIQNAGMSVYEKAVYAVLCSHANQEADCFPSYKTIAIETPCSERQAKSIIKQLEIKGYIIITHRKDKNGKSSSNIYKILTEGASDAQGSADTAPSHSELNAQGSESYAHELYKNNNIKYFNNINLSIEEQAEIDGIIEHLGLDIFDKTEDKEIFEEVIRRMYAAPFIKVFNMNQPQIAVRNRLKKLNQEIVCSAFDKYTKELPKNPINFLTSLLYNEMCEYKSFDLQCRRAEVI